MRAGSAALGAPEGLIPNANSFLATTNVILSDGGERSHNREYIAKKKEVLRDLHPEWEEEKLDQEAMIYEMCCTQHMFSGMTEEIEKRWIEERKKLQPPPLYPGTGFAAIRSLVKTMRLDLRACSVR